MRVTTGMIYDQGVGSIQRQTGQLLHTQQQVSTGRRILTPADDPVSSARALEVTQAKSVNDQFQLNQAAATDLMGLVENKLTAVQDLLVAARTRAVEAGNGTYSPAELRDIATDLRGQFDALMALANSQDGNGEYLFAGYRGNTQPFTGSVASGVAYQGDQGERSIQVSASRVVPVSSSGADVFMKVPGMAGSVFEVMDRLITALESGTQNSAFHTDLAQSVDGLDKSLDNVLRVRAAVGSRMNEVEALQNVASDLTVQYTQTLSRLQDVDYAQAVSDLTLQQTYLQAAQQSFMRVSQLSLFNYLGS